MRRRLAAILAADIVGYSRMIEQDETGVIERFKADRAELLEPTISEHSGAIVQFAGDGLLVEFASIVEAVECALAIQCGMQTRNANRPADQKIIFRIGVNLGDIVVEEDNLHGEGIILAARLENLAQPGTILISERVAELVEGKIAAPITYVAQRQVKNIERPVRIYQVSVTTNDNDNNPLTRSKPPSHPPSTTASTTANQTLLGRITEIERLQAILDDCLAGYAQIVLLTGSAGSGKTRLADEIAKLAQQRNAQVVWGQCREDSGAPAYWPWRQLLRTYLRDQNTATTIDSPELANLLPELFKQPDSVDNDSDSPDQAQSRFLLFHTVAELLAGSAQQLPLVLIFDDLHRADNPSLRLLEFIAAELGNQPILIIGTYRDTDVPPGHRFQETLSELSRLNNYQTIGLGNLDSTAVSDLVRQILSLPEDRLATVAQQVYERTEGHPLYLVETLRHLRQGGANNELPTSLRAIISQRFAQLPAASVQTLQAAAVIGRRFELLPLSKILDSDIDQTLQSLDPALLGLQIETLERPGHYQFSHALIRETLYDTLSGSERLHLHRSLAAVLEDADEEPAEIAYHYHQAAPLGVADKATHFSEQAALQAKRMLAYEEAARFYRQALNTASKQQTPVLMFALGNVQLHAGESLQALATFDKTTELAERSGEFKLYAQAAMGIEEALWRPGLPGDNAVRVLQQALTYITTSDTALNIYLQCALVRAFYMIGDDLKARELQQKTEVEARQHNNPVVLARSLLAGMFANQQPQYLPERLRKGEEAKQLAKTAGEQILYHDVLMWNVNDLLHAGDINTLNQTLAEQRALAKSHKQPFYQYYIILTHVTLALARGDFKTSEARSLEALTLARWLPGQDLEGVHGMQMFCIRREQGRLRELAPVVEYFVNTTPDDATWQPGLALIYSELNQKDKAQALFDKLAKNDFAALPRDGLWATCLAYLSDVCVFLDAKAQAQFLYDQLLPYQGCQLVIGISIGCLGAADRFLGTLATILQNWADAEAHFAQALALNERSGFSLWQAHNRYHYAAMLAQRKQNGDLEQAADLLAAALQTAQELDMATLIERVSELQQQLQGRKETSTANSPDSLSKREIEVLKLIAMGKDNKEIGATLFISPNTVAAHIRNILGKTKTSNRTEAAAYATEQGLLSQ